MKAIYVVSDSQCIVNYQGRQKQYDHVRDIVIRDGIAYLWLQDQGISIWDSVIDNGTILHNDWPYMTFIHQHCEGAEWAGTTIYMIRKDKQKHFRVGGDAGIINFEYYGLFYNQGCYIIENGVDSFSVVDTTGRVLKSYPWPKR